MRNGQSLWGGVDYQFRRAKYALRGHKFSHANEQEILAKYIRELLPPNHSRTVVDIGAGNGMRWSNTYSLFLQGWSGVGIETDRRKFVQMQRAYQDLPLVRACHGRAEPANIVALLHSFNVPKNLSVLSLDIDGNDYWVLRAILNEFRPFLIVSEINEKIPPPIRFVVKFNPEFELKHHFYGYSIAAIEDLCAEHNYSILELEYNNVFLAPKEIARDKAINANLAYRTGYQQRADRARRFKRNSDMESLQSMDLGAAMDFLRQFYKSEKGNYLLASNQEKFTEELQSLD